MTCPIKLPIRLRHLLTVDRKPGEIGGVTRNIAPPPPRNHADGIEGTELHKGGGVSEPTSTLDEEPLVTYHIVPVRSHPQRVIPPHPLLQPPRNGRGNPTNAGGGIV